MNIKNKAPPIHLLKLKTIIKKKENLKAITVDKIDKMRTKEFEVPSDFITEFAEALDEHELANEINGVIEQGEILIEVSY